MARPPTDGAGAADAGVGDVDAGAGFDWLLPRLHYRGGAGIGESYRTVSLLTIVGDHLFEPPQYS